MIELIISFFASVGVILLIVELCDFLFYRTYNPKTLLTVDLTGCDEQEIIRLLEVISTIRRKRSGKAVLGRIAFRLDKNKNNEEFLYHYMNIFQIPGKIMRD